MMVKIYLLLGENEVILIKEENYFPRLAAEMFVLLEFFKNTPKVIVE